MDNTITLYCMNGFILYVDGANLVVAQKRKEEVYPIPSIQSFAFKEPHGISPGTITFSTAQAPAFGVNFGTGITAALGSEKNFFFPKSELETARQFREYVTNYREAPQPTATGTVVSVVEEIRGLKQLLDEGILTQEEFEAKKKQLLGI